MAIYTYDWTWDEAFDKFGFEDGDGPSFLTYEVVSFLRGLGLEVHADSHGMHNTMIFGIKRDGVELIDSNVTQGYDDPRSYLPDDIVAALNEKFGEASGNMTWPEAEED